MSQLSYAVDMAAGKEGGLYDAGENDVLSFLNPVDVIPFGKLVVRDAEDDECKLPAASTDITDVTKALGLALALQNIEQSTSGVAQYVAKSVVSVLRKGRAWVKVEETVTVNSTVHVRYAAGGNGVGSFGDTTGTSERAPLAGAKYLTGASANGLAVVEFNL